MNCTLSPDSVSGFWSIFFQKVVISDTNCDTRILITIPGILLITGISLLVTLLIAGIIIFMIARYRRNSRPRRNAEAIPIASAKAPNYSSMNKLLQNPSERDVRNENKSNRRSIAGRSKWWSAINRNPEGKLVFSRYRIDIPATTLFTSYTPEYPNTHGTEQSRKRVSFGRNSRESERSPEYIGNNIIKINNRDTIPLRITISIYNQTNRPVEGDARITFLPNEVTLQPGDAADVEMDVIPISEGTTKMLIAFTPYLVNTDSRKSVDSERSKQLPAYYIPINVDGVAINRNQPKINWNEVQKISVLGQGASGIVYKAEYPSGRIVAVKKFLVAELSEEDLREFVLEAQLLHRYKHPCVVESYGICSTYPNLAVVMEYLPLGSLGAILRGSEQDAKGDVAKETLLVGLPWSLRIKFAFDAARAMAFLHRMSVLHRDIKSDNFLVTSLDINANVNIKVADLSISKDLSTPRSRNTVVSPGSAHWKAPEILRGGAASKSSDIWSYGVVMWEIVTRKLPYADKKWKFDIEDLVKGGGKPDIPIDPEMPVEYAMLMSACWNGVENLRPTFDDVVAKLRRIQIERSWRKCAVDNVKWSTLIEEDDDDSSHFDEVL